MKRERLDGSLQAVVWVDGCFGGGEDLLRFMRYLHEQVNGREWPFDDLRLAQAHRDPSDGAAPVVLPVVQEAVQTALPVPGYALFPRVVAARALGKANG